MRPCSMMAYDSGPKPGAHEQVLNVAQAAELSVQQIFAFAGAEEPPRNGDLSGLECALELATANLEHDLRTGERRLASALASAAAFFFVALAGTDFLDIALGVVGVRRTHRRLIPVLGHVVLHIDFRLTDVAVHHGIDQRQRDLSHARGLALAGAGEDDVLHVDAAQRTR